MKKIFIWAATAAVALGMGFVALPKETQTETASAAVTTYFQDNFDSYSSYGSQGAGSSGSGTVNTKWANQFFDGIGDGNYDQSCTNAEIEVVTFGGSKVLKLKTATTNQSFFYLTPRDPNTKKPMELLDYEFSFRFYLDGSSTNMKNNVNSSVAPWLAVLNRKTAQDSNGDYVPTDGRYNGTNSLMTSVRAGYREGEAAGTTPYFFSEFNRVKLSSMGACTEKNEDRSGNAVDITNMTLLNTWHTYKVKVIGNEVDLYIDGVHLAGFSIPTSATNKMFRTTGYVSIACCVWDGYIDDVLITSASTTKTYTIAATKNIDAADTVTGAGAYAEGDSVSLKATTNEGYTFLGWYNGSTKVSSSATYTFNASADLSLQAKWKAKKYTITFDKNIAAAGTLKVDGTEVTSGTYDYGSTITVVASTKSGYTWKGWNDGTTSLTKTITVTGDATYEAQWTSNKVTITTTKNIDEAGKVSGGGEVEYGAEATVRAASNTGYTWLGWYDGATKVSSTATYTFTATESKTLQARWEIKSYTITLSVNSSTAGRVQGAGTFNYGEVKTVKAVTNKGYTFLGWFESGSETAVSTSETYTLPALTKNVTLQAKWEIPQYTIAISSNNATAGKVSGGGELDLDSSATVKATTLSDDYYFDGWYEGTTRKSTSLEYTFTVKKDVTLQAKWIKKVVLTTSKNIDAAGTVTAGGKYQHGTAVSLTATTNSGYRFDGWYVDGTRKSQALTYNFTISEDTAVEARWIQIFVVTLDKNFPAGNVLGAGTYDKGDSVTVKASIDGQYSFDGWYEGGEEGTKVSSDSTYTFEATKNVELYAKWISNIATYEVTVSAEKVNDQVAGTVEGAGKYQEGSMANLTVTTKKGYAFDGWYVNSVKVSNAATYTFAVDSAKTVVAKWTVKNVTVYFDTKGGAETIAPVLVQEGKAVAAPTAPTKKGYTFSGWLNGTIAWDFANAVDANMTLEASWEINSYTITLVNDNAEAGAITGEGAFNYGAQATLTATANNGFVFDGWYIDTAKVSSNATFTFTVNEDKTYTAKWVRNQYTVAVEKNIAAAGTVEGDATYASGANVELTATTNDGYKFEGWFVGGENKSTEATYTFTVNEDVTVVAKWALNKFTVAIERSHVAAGTVTGGGVYEADATATLTATTNDGYEFDGWYVGEQKISAEATYDYTVANEDVTIVAKWNVSTPSATAVEKSANVKLGDTASIFITPNVAIVPGQFKDGTGVEVDSLAFTYDQASGEILFDANYILDLGIGTHTFTVKTSMLSYNITLTVTGGGEVTKSATAGTDVSVVLKAGAEAYSVKKDGADVDEKAYSINAKDGKVIFEGAYLADLGEGAHQFTVETNLGTYIVTLNVKVKADADGAGCGNSVGLSSAVTLLGLAGAALVASKRRKKK